MKERRVLISGMGIVSPLGIGIEPTTDSLLSGKSHLSPLRVFTPARGNPLPVGQVDGLDESGGGPLPRTHQLALTAARQAMDGQSSPPGAVVIGLTTGGILTTERLLREKNVNPADYRYHSLNSVALAIAREFDCNGPVLTVSTACSSGAAALKIAAEMVRAGLFDTVLAGGVDSLCRLTYYGFRSLQLVDPDGGRPLDRDRKGMSVAEASAMLLLTSQLKHGMHGEILGGGLSCDAYHPTAPHPEGHGAVTAMALAVESAGLSLSDIGYINLHGTGTFENDRVEARAIQTFFQGNIPPLSSVKGAMGHSLGAAGAVEAVISALTVSEGLIPANTGCSNPDPALSLNPVGAPLEKTVSAVLSNSFGFGGNNASLVIARPGQFPCKARGPVNFPLTVMGCACLTGFGGTAQTMEQLGKGETVKEALSLAEVSKRLNPRETRRLKRLSRLALALSLAACEDCGLDVKPSSVFMGTGWGALSETFDFLAQLQETGEQFPNPIDFAGSSHNAAAGQIAVKFGAAGPNITMSGGDWSFEQALMASALLTDSSSPPFLVLGADEAHARLSPLFDPSAGPDRPLVDGGGAFLLTGRARKGAIQINLPFFRIAHERNAAVDGLINELGGPDKISAVFGVVLAGVPYAFGGKGRIMLEEFLSKTAFKGPVIDYRQLTGEFASASAVAAVLAVQFLETGKTPALSGAICEKELKGQGVLVLGLGDYVSAVEIRKG